MNENVDDVMRGRELRRLEREPAVFGATLADGKHVDPREAKDAQDFAHVHPDGRVFEMPDEEPAPRFSEPVAYGMAGLLTGLGTIWALNLPDPILYALSAIAIGLYVVSVRAAVKPV
jgi:hypothetical protein